MACPVICTSEIVSVAQVVSSHPAASVQMELRGLAPNASYRLEVFRTGYHANDAYTAYLEMGSPGQLTTEQIAHLNDLTMDAPEPDKLVRSELTGTIEFTIPMNSNDIVLVKLMRNR